MRTEILPPNEIPAMTADHMRRAIAQICHAYETGDRVLAERIIADDFSFTSPYDDAIGREDYFRRWRFNHVTTVERLIGHKTGSGGTTGVGYLRRALEVVLFPELWQVRTEL